MKGAKESPKFMKRYGNLQSSLGASFRRYRCRMHVPLPAGRFETSQGEIGWANFSIAVRCFCVSFLSRQCKITPQQNIKSNGLEKVKKIV